MTFVNRYCTKCSYSYRESIYGYVHDPIGPAYCICPKCGTLQLDASSKEWAQMSPFKKFLSVSPRSRSTGWFLAIVLFVPLLMLCIALVNLFKLSLGTAAGPLVFVPLLIAYFLAIYLLTVIKVNCASFRERWGESVLRSRNPEYRVLLDKAGDRYDESIPGWFLCSKKSRAKMEAYLAEHALTEVKIPSIPDTIRNA